MNKQNYTQVFFWDDDLKPQDYINKNKSQDDRDKLAKILEKGKEKNAYRGMACCRICGDMIGSKDLVGHGFMWPQGAEHYVQEHKVWPPGADELIIKANEEQAGG